MTIDTDEVFRYKVPIESKLLKDGFSYDGKSFQKQVPILNNQFTMNIEIELGGKIDFTVIDNAFEEEYALVHARNAQGTFINEVRSACENVLINLSQKCFNTEILKAEQTKRIISKKFPMLGWMIDYKN